MRKSLVIFISLLAAAILLVVLQFVGIYSQRAYAATLAIGGIALIAFRGAIAAWIQARSAASPLGGHWRMTRPATVVLYGIGLLMLSAASLINGKH